MRSGLQETIFLLRWIFFIITHWIVSQKLKPNQEKVYSYFMSIKTLMLSSWHDQSLMFLLKISRGCVTLVALPCLVACDRRTLSRGVLMPVVEYPAQLFR